MCIRDSLMVDHRIFIRCIFVEVRNVPFLTTGRVCRSVWITLRIGGTCCDVETGRELNRLELKALVDFDTQTDTLREHTVRRWIARRAGELEVVPTVTDFLQVVERVVRADSNVERGAVFYSASGIH